MDIKLIIIFVALANFLLGALLLFRSRKSKSAIAFGVFAISLGVWSLSLYFYEHPFWFSSLFWIRIVYSIVLFPIIPSALYFVLTFPEDSEKRRLTTLSLLFYFIPALVLLNILWFSGWWVKDVIITTQGLRTLLGPAYIAFGIVSALFGLWMFIILVKNYLHAKSILKMQLRYIFIGLFFYVISTILVDVILPLMTGYSEYFWLSPVFSLFLVGATVYAITRYRLMDIRLVIKKSGVFFLALSIVVSLTIFIIWLIAYLIDYRPNPILMAGGALAMAMTVLVFVPLRSFLQKVADRLFFKEITSYQEAIKHLSSQLVTIIDLGKLVNLVVETTRKTMGLDKTGVLLRDEKSKKYKIQKIIGFKEENGISLVKDNFLTEYLENTAKPLVYEELKLMIRDAKDNHQRQRLIKLRDNMQRIEAVVCLPLLMKGKLRGLVVLGRKISGDAYSKEDMRLLETLANQASIALENAGLYEEIKKLKQGLQDKVVEQTRTIRSQLKQIRSLSRAREEFIEIASHQLRTPISGAWSFMSSFVDGSLENESKKERRKDYKKIYQAMAKLKTVVNQIIDALAVQKIGGLKLVNKKMFNVEEALSRLLRSKTSPLKIEAEEKKIKFKIIQKPSPLPFIWADAYYFKSVLLALADNAVKYSSLGSKVFFLLMAGRSSELKDQLLALDKKIDPFFHKDKDLKKEILSSLKGLAGYEKLFFFLVQDQGIGIPRKDQKKIFHFKPFQRAENARSVHTDGSGLSLYLAHNILKAHQARLFLYSQGRNRGATAWFWLKMG